MTISIQNLHKTYRGGVRALNSLYLEVPNGMFGLLGPNGAGKTTLMRILAGILRPTSGTIRVDEYDGTNERGRMAIRRMLGYLPQDLGVYPDLSAREFLDYIAILKGLDQRSARRQRVDQLLETVALSQVAKRKLKTFSGGMKRRVGIAQALLNDPRLLIVDEPTAGLDPEERIRFRNLLADLAGQRTVLLSTHIVEDIAQTCQHVALIKAGQTLYQGSIAQMLQATQGRVWQLATNDPRPSGNFMIVSSLHLGSTIQYRIVGDPPAGVHATPSEPGLEDAYVWYMHANAEQPAQQNIHA